MTKRPLCALCPHAAVVVDTPKQRSFADVDQPWCAAHVPPRPAEGFERVRLDSNRTQEGSAR